MDDKDKTIDALWEHSNHGTQREDVVRAYEAGQAAERERCARLCEQMGAATWWPNEARDMADLLRKMILEGPNAELTGNRRRAAP